MSTEQERAPRIDRRLRATILCVEAGERGQDIHAELMDASKTGLGLRSPVPLRIGTAINVTVHLARKTETGCDHLTVPACVTGCIPVAEGGHHHVGAELGQLSLHDAQLWHDTIQRWRTFVV